MNPSFAAYTGSTAFGLQLTARQCNALLRLDAQEKDIWHGSSLMTLRALEVKGLVSWSDAESVTLSDHPARCAPPKNAFRGLTEAGRHLVALLKIAGLTIDNTATPASLRERFARNAQVLAGAQAAEAEAA